MESAKELRSLVFAGLTQKQLEINNDVFDRLNHELSVIEKLSLVEYFLIYSRIVGICNKEGILRSYGRGSACCSLVNYCLDITKINPLQEGLIFERFLNPELSKLADIDIDVPVGVQKIIVDRLKVELPGHTINYIAHHSSRQPNEYKKLKINNKDYEKPPCAVIISKEPLPFPTYTLGDDTYYICDDFLNIKDIFQPFQFDILELEYLNKLERIWKQIGEDYHPYNLNLNDRETLDIYTKGDLKDIFQFTTGFSQRMIPKFQPSNIYDLAIFNAMYRPGPMDYIPHLIIIKRKGFGEFCGSDSRVRSILLETYGLLIYQETFLHLAHEIAGFSFTEADTFRRPLFLQKDESVIQEFKEKFAVGCKLNSSLNNDDLNTLIDTILFFMPKAFLKSHALSYTIIGYWGAFYKAHFRSKFEAAFGMPEKPDEFDGLKTA